MKSKIILHTFFALIFIFSSGCEPGEGEEKIPETSVVTDIDNNVYKTVKIGDQWWMMENLKVTRFRNGKLIPKAQTTQDWQNEFAAYCIYDNNDRSPGLLYNYYAVADTSHIAPEGWHVPTDEDWKKLELFLGMSAAEADKLNWRGTTEGDKMKIEGPEGWTRFSNVWGTNESGFAALAGSCRMYNGVWGNPGLFSAGFWWSSSVNENNEAWYRYLDYKKSNVFRFYGPKTYGFSIRCIKD